MKKTQTFIKRDIQGETIMITLQGIAGFIWDHIEEANSLEHLVDMITSEFDVDRKTAGSDAIFFIMQLLRAGMIRTTGKNW